jgi:hypothetical protein
MRNNAIVAAGVIVVLIFTNPASAGIVIDLNSISANVTICGDDAGDTLGYSVSSGDFNGDGKDDVIIGAHRADTVGGAHAGKTYVIYGSNSLPSTTDLNSVFADITIHGDDAYGYLGDSVSSGDFNGDDIDDIIIGAPFTNPAGRIHAGKTYIIYGSGNLPSTIDLNSVSADVTICGDYNGDRLGISISSGDFNGDGIDDIIIGADTANFVGGNSVGKTYIIYGSNSLPSTIDLNSVFADVTICGDDAIDRSGSSVSSGDINGDGMDDIIIGAPNADPAGGSFAGETYVIYGSNSLHRPQQCICRYNNLWG